MLPRRGRKGVRNKLECPLFPSPNTDLREDIKLDFEEARATANISPRGAAALLRLCVQKLCEQLGQAGKNIDTDIANLVTAGLPVEVQQALDVVRVVGNNAVHPGQLDVKDDRETVEALFGLVNLIADRMITQKKQLAALYEKLPQGAKDAIAKRDENKAQ